VSTWDERMTPRPKPAPKLELVRTLWTMNRPPNKPMTAALYELKSGRELRVHVGSDPNNLVDSLLSREGDLPLTFRADELRAVLLEQGWSSRCDEG
jgi:hypothetical protein